MGDQVDIVNILNPYNQNKTLTQASDVTINAVITSFNLNIIIFIVIMAIHEILRRKFPIIYYGRCNHVDPSRLIPSPYNYTPKKFDFFPNWMLSAFRVPWSIVRDCCGLDAYMFLRYIRMCARITFVTGIWGVIVMWPVFSNGKGEAEGWYYFSMSNLIQGSRVLWVPTIFLWLFSLYVFYVMNNEYHHFLNLRMEFLGKGDSSVHPQHYYSLLVEQIPKNLRSDLALYDYFNSLFPGKVHSASIVLKLPKLEKLSIERERVIQRLEKSIAHYEATKERPSHIIGRPRLTCLGVQTEPLDCCSCRSTNGLFEEENPPKGAKVDSIKYYSNQLKEMNKELIALQIKKSNIAVSGNSSIKAIDWIREIIWKSKSTSMRTNSQTLYESSQEDITEKVAGNRDNENTDGLFESELLQSIAPLEDESKPESEVQPKNNAEKDENNPQNTSISAIFNIMTLFRSLTPKKNTGNANNSSSESTMGISSLGNERDNVKRMINAVADYLGMDFVKDSFNFVQNQIGIGNTMSSTGFVTFTDLATSTCTASTQLTHRTGLLRVSHAPEPRDIIWRNAHTDYNTVKKRQIITGILLALGAILWSIPLTLIQAFATSETLSRIPGFSGLMTWNGGSLIPFLNGYLPVVALLILIMLLPIIFEHVAMKFEYRKTYSQVQNSILSRYFYYQLANIYISVTAGSLWISLSEILDRPSNALSILGVSLPTLVGYFVSLLLTKIFAGLPMTLLRGGSLFRMLLLRGLFKEASLTQRELDEVYRPQFLLLGWEYPTQLLVIIICFTYACISPVILPFGATYFGVAYIIYKQQILYVYTPRYESGGESFPLAMQRTLVGLFCAQLTFIGYLTIRRGIYQPIVTFPLLIITLFVMRDFKKRFVSPSQSLSLERAKVLDEKSTLTQDNTLSPDISASFNVHAYRQPIRTEGIGIPLPYRHGQTDQLREEVEAILELDSAQRVQEYQRNIRKTVAKNAHTSTHDKKDDFTWFLVRKEKYLENQSKLNAEKSDQKTIDICAVINARSEYYMIKCNVGRHFLYCNVGIKSNNDNNSDTDISDNLGDAVALHRDKTMLNMYEVGDKICTPFRINHGIIQNADQYFDMHTILQDLDLKNEMNVSFRNTNGQLEMSKNIPTLKTIWLRCEPFSIHVACRSIPAANELMRRSRSLFENVSLISWKQKESLVSMSTRNILSEVNTKSESEIIDGECIVAIRGSDHINMPLSVLSHDSSIESHNRKWSIGNELLKGNEKWIQTLINERLERDWAKIDQFIEDIKSMSPTPIDVL